MQGFQPSEDEIDNALLALAKHTGRTRPELLRDMLLQELHFSSFLEEKYPPQNKSERSAPAPV